METEPEAPRKTMTKQMIVKDDGRYLYLYTFPKKPADDILDTAVIEETPEAPYV